MQRLETTGKERENKGRGISNKKYRKGWRKMVLQDNPNFAMTFLVSLACDHSRNI